MVKKYWQNQQGCKEFPEMAPILEPTHLAWFLYCYWYSVFIYAAIFLQPPKVLGDFQRFT